MQLVFVLEAAQDRDRVLDRRLVDEDRLKAPRQRRVFLDIFAIFVERRRADAVNVAARQRRLEQVRGVHRAVGSCRRRPAVCISSMNRMMPPSACAYFRRARLFRRSSNSPRYFAPAISAPMSSASSFLPFRLSGTSPLTMRSASPSRNRRLADAGLADQHRVVLGAARRAPGSCGGFPRRGRSPGRACRRGLPRSGRAHISSSAS